MLKTPRANQSSDDTYQKILELNGSKYAPAKLGTIFAQTRAELIAEEFEKLSKNIVNASEHPHSKSHASPSR